MADRKVKVNDEPETLQTVCIHYLAQHIDCIATKTHGLWSLKPGISLTQVLCEKILSACNELGIELNDSLLHIFNDVSNTRLRRACCRKASKLSDIGLEYVLKHGLVELDISHCESLSPQTVLHINKYCRGLNTLLIGSSHCVLSDIDFGGLGNEPLTHDDLAEEQESDFYMYMKNDTQEAFIRCNAEPSIDKIPQHSHRGHDLVVPKSEGEYVFKQDYIFDCPELRMFSLHNLTESSHHWSQDLIATILNNLTKLRYLDLSGCDINVEFMDCIENLRCLTHLIIFDVPITDTEGAFQVIGKVKSLRHLDVGQSSESSVLYAEPEKNMRDLLSWLPFLNSLDLSGTNLAGHAVTQPRESLRPTKLSSTEFQEREQRKSEENCFPAFSGRRFEFLGLLNSSYRACERENIPAKKVTGDATEDQIILSLHVYMEKKELLIRCLNELFQVFRQSTCKRQSDALEGILNAMKCHIEDKHIQISGSASIFYIVKGEDKTELTTKAKRRIVTALLNGMEHHISESTMVRNCCLTLCHFSLPKDLLFIYPRVVRVLLMVVDQIGQEEFVQRIGIYLLNSLACQVDGSEKQLIGQLGGIDTMLRIIRQRLAIQNCDEVMEIAWSTMWNVTDETPLNCERFMNGHGMHLFIECLEAFPESADLLRNMMGLMGNIAEVDFIRPKLMTAEYLRLFSTLLLSKSDGIEVSYNAAGVLAHMLFDGPQAWTVDEPSYAAVAGQMSEVIQQWNLNAQRNINYRSFEPILRLIRVGRCSQSQHWAIWALCNLTLVYPDKYCPLLIREGGMELLEKVISSEYQMYVTDMAKEVVDRCRRHQLSKPSGMSTSTDGAEEQISE